MQNANRCLLFQISCIGAPESPNFPFYIPHFCDALFLPLCSMTSFIMPYLQMMLCIERQLQMKDAEDDGDVDDVDWEDMEIEDDMENLYSLLALKKQPNLHYSTGRVYWKWKFNFFQDDLGRVASSDVSPTFLSNHKFKQK